MSGNKKDSGCSPETIIHNDGHKHSLLCAHKAFLDVARNRVVYLQDDEFHETCDHGHVHRAPLCPKQEFTKVARPDEDCSKRKDCHVHIREDGVAEVHKPAEEGAKEHKCTVINTLRPLT
ncbi:MAG: hypothetical protein H6867_05365 [Rhodospirillales bacterium]|nr:hypothetical protein [Rhodospirillales bacterium]MCB9994958.1 hypothetical protein [Rhodospirillales bacterium]